MLLSKYLSFSTAQHIKKSAFFLVQHTIWLFLYNWHIGNFLFFSSLKIIVRNKTKRFDITCFFCCICFNYFAEEQNVYLVSLKLFHVSHDVSLELVNLQREKNIKRRWLNAWKLYLYSFEFFYTCTFPFFKRVKNWSDFAERRWNKKLNFKASDRRMKEMGLL